MLDLRSQSVDMGVEGAVVGRLALPHRRHELLSRVDPAGTRCERREQIELASREGYGLTVAIHRARIERDRQRSDLEILPNMGQLVEARGVPPVAKCCLDPRHELSHP